MRHFIVLGVFVLAGCPTGNDSIDGICGDGIQDPSEACDDGNLIANDACTDICELARCGDQIVQIGVETCDDGNSIDTDVCPTSCQAAVCGDGFLRTDLVEGDPGYETCDDGNNDNGDSCNANCMMGSCGDGLVDAELGEECDDANDVATDRCISCVLASCGDGYVREGEERCDDGNQNTYDACTNECQPAHCGDGILRNDLTQEDDGFEVCDDGNDSNLDGCTSECTAAICGDGYIHTGIEECDDDNLVDTDACRNDCTVAQCGDGVLRSDIDEGEDGYEACDDGNTEPRDACTDLCRVATCGDGRVRHDIVDLADDRFEECDDGNNDNHDGCLDRCRNAVCGDGVTRTDRAEEEDGFENCDDGNTDNRDACTNSCIAARCGDSIVRNDLQNPNQQGWEDCDDGNVRSGDNCSANCFAEPASLAMGPYHTCITTHQGPAYCWGAGSRGQLGNGAQDSQTEPVRVISPVVFEVNQGGGPGREVRTHFTQIAVGGYHTCGVTAEGGHVMCWGWNNQGQRGHGQRATEFRNSPMLTANNGNTQSLALGSYHSCAINDRGQIKCWGQNQLGQLGLGDNDNRYQPQTLNDLRSNAILSAGPYITCSRTPSDVECFGSNAGYPMHPNQGGQNIGYTDPVRVTNTTRTRDFAVGGTGHACEINPRYELDCWGNNSHGQSNPTLQSANRQTRRRIRTHLVSVALGHLHGCAITTQRTVVCWGDNSHGQLGRQTLGIPRQPIEQINGLNGIIELVAGEFSTCARAEDNTIWCWGKNTQGQLGDGTANSRHTPRRVELN